MKYKILKKIEKIIINSNKNINETKLEEIMYGIESVYLTIEKIALIFLIAIILAIPSEVAIFMLIYNVIRFTAFGAHAKNSLLCLIMSTIIFIGIPLLGKYLILSNLIKIIIGILCIIIFIIYAPADTEKRPIISIKRRRIYKTISCIIGLIYTSLSIIINNYFMDNVFIFSLVLQSIMILPITYKILGVSYNNYKNYKKDG